MIKGILNSIADDRILVWTITEDTGDSYFLTHRDNGKRLRVLTPKGRVVSDDQIELINYWEALKDPYFQQYAKRPLTSLLFNGFLVSCLPINFDLGLWAQLFIYNDLQFVGELSPPIRASN